MVVNLYPLRVSSLPFALWSPSDVTDWTEHKSTSSCWRYTYCEQTGSWKA